MTSILWSGTRNYECAHCKQLSHGEPAETLLIDDEQLNMCCLGCACAAELLIDLRHCSSKTNLA